MTAVTTARVAAEPSVTIAVITPDLPAAGPMLRSLAQQQAPGTAQEVVVVCTGPTPPECTGPTPPESGAAAVPHTVICVPGASRGEAADAVADKAVTRYLLVVDGADTVSPGYVAALVAAARPGVVPVPRVESADGHPVVETAGSETIAPADAPALLALPGALLEVDDVRRMPWDGASDLVAQTRRLSSYAQQYDTLDVTPGATGAVYRLAGPAPALTTDDLAALVALAEGGENGGGHLADAAARYVADELRRHGDLNDDTLHAVLPHDSDARESLRAEGHPWLAHLIAPTVGGPGPVTLVAWNGRFVARWAPAIRFLKRQGVPVTVIHVTGSISATGRRNATVHKIAHGPRARTTAPVGVKAQLRDGLGSLAGAATEMFNRAAPDGWMKRQVIQSLPERAPAAVAALQAAGTIFALDETGAALARAQEGMADRTIHTQPDFGREVMTLATRRPLSHPNDVQGVVGASRRVAQNARSLGLTPELWAAVGYRLLRGWRHEELAAVVNDAVGCCGDEACREYGLDALRRLADLDTPLTPAESRALADDVLTRADAALARGDRLLASFLTTLSLDLLFATDQHTSVPQTPLTTSGTTHLAPLYSHTASRLLLQDSPRVPTRSLPTDREPVVALLPGTFPKFADAVSTALEGSAAVQIATLRDADTRFGNIVPDQMTVAEVVLPEAERPRLVPQHVYDELREADVVFCDWADKGAVLASRTVEPGTRLVVRAHGVDTISAWLHVIDWGRVTHFLLPSPHLESVARALLGSRLDGVDVHVVPNHVDVARFTTQKDEDARYALGMVGWTQRVKDPVFALETLALLRAEDPRYTLTLIGADYAGTLRWVEAEAADAFRERALRDDVRDGVRYVGYTRRLEEHLTRIGWALSTSRRESFHIGLAEMAASGAVPVVRNWPVYATQDGAATLFPREWVVDTPAQAAERILAIQAEGRWEAESAAARATVEDRFGGEVTAQILRDIVVG